MMDDIEPMDPRLAVAVNAVLEENEQYKAEREVIEAARGLLVDRMPLQLRVDRVVSAVRALEQAEEGE